MRVTILSIGRERDAAVAALCEEYLKRLRWPTRLILLDERKATGAGTQAEREARLLRASLPPGARMIALDERGNNYDSPAFAKFMGQMESQGAGDVAFLIGGADGLDRAFAQSAHARLALGPMTWPHRLVRVMILEQLYRAQTILDGHPYHRA